MIQNCWFGRYQSVTEVVVDIEQVRDLEGVPPAPVSMIK